MRGEVQADVFHDLRLYRENDDVGIFDRVGVGWRSFDTMLDTDFAALFGATVTGANGAGVDALRAQTADQTGSHVPAPIKAMRGVVITGFLSRKPDRFNQVLL